MAEFTVPAVWMLVPLLALGAFTGYRRSWARETLTGLGLAILLVASGRLVSISLAILTLIGRIAREVFAAVGVSVVTPERVLGRVPRPLILGVATFAFVALAYRLGYVLGGKGSDSRLGRLTGAAVGALNVLLLLAIFAETARRALGPARLRRLFLIPGSGRGVDVTVPPFPPSAVLAQWSAYAVVVLLLIALGWGITRLPKLKG